MIFLAKDDGKTILEHTQDLLKQYNVYKATYPNLLKNEEWDLLKLACKYHDLGKINAKFQGKIRENKFKIENEIPHALLSVTMINLDYLKTYYSDYQIKALLNAVAFHHERDFSEITDDNYKNEVHLLKKEYDNFSKDNYKELDLFPYIPKIPSRRYFSFKHKLDEDDTSYNLYVKIKGSLNLIDFASSGNYSVAYANSNYLDYCINLNMKSKKYLLNNMQKYMQEHTDDNVVCIAQTGMGKTVGGLKWIGNNKGILTEPLKSADNAIYKRVSNVLKNNHEKHIALVHSDSATTYSDIKAKNEARNYSKQLTVTTLDNLFTTVFKYAGYESKFVTLLNSKVIIDEIQMYSANILAYLLVNLKELTKGGGKFAIMTATFAPFILDLMKELNIKIDSKESFVNENLTNRHSIELLDSEINAEDIIKKYKDNKVIVICNTVKKAQELYKSISDKLADVHILHSKYIKKDRLKLENSIIDFSSSDDKGIWITTQVAEASLDIDFDVLFTEMSELNSLFQRMGRCYRKRNYDGDTYNVYVYKKASGVYNDETSIYDYDMYRLSLKALKGVDGLINENEKSKLIDKFYTTDKLKNSNYYRNIKDTLNILETSRNGSISKAEASQRFRSINTYTAIPYHVYKDNIKLFETEKVNYKDVLDLSLNVYESDIKNATRLELNKNFSVYVLDDKYNYSKIGLSK